VSLHLVYRSYGGENKKNRPAYYSKLLAVASFLRAAEGVEAEIVFINDGPLPQERLQLMVSYGEVVTLGGVGMRRSYRYALQEPRRRNWAGRDVVYFGEDDYLYRPDAFSKLEAAAEAIPSADYLALYGSTPERPVQDRLKHQALYPKNWRQLPATTVNGQAWTNIISTASTFGARVGALDEDLTIFMQCMLPYRHRLMDHETCVVYQGYQPFEWRALAANLFLKGHEPLNVRGKRAFAAPFHAALNLRARRRSDRRRLLYAADPNLATHLELSWLSPDVDWEDVALQTASWARGRGLLTGAKMGRI
jgi:hypothetical protein